MMLRCDPAVAQRLRSGNAPCVRLCPCEWLIRYDSSLTAWLPEPCAVGFSIQLALQVHSDFRHKLNTNSFHRGLSGRLISLAGRSQSPGPFYTVQFAAIAQRRAVRERSRRLALALQGPEPLGKPGI